MELHLNGQKLCDISEVYKSSYKKCVIQMGKMVPLEDLAFLDMYSSCEPVVGMNSQFSIIEGADKIGITIWHVIPLNNGQYLSRITLN